MRYTGVVRTVPVRFVADRELSISFVLGHGIQGQFRDSEGKEEWRTSKVLTQ